jgi:glycogen operon protein
VRGFAPELQDLSLSHLLSGGDRTWHGVRIGNPDWGTSSHSLALRVLRPDRGIIFYLILNAYWNPLEFELPDNNGKQWRRWIDTTLDSPHDISEWHDAMPVSNGTYCAGPHSVVALYSLL